jgi:hypothetical protein
MDGRKPTLPPASQYVPHQLLVHLDEHANGDIEIRYDYPFSGAHPLPEQVIRLPAHTVPEQLHADLAAMRTFLRERLEVDSVRIPHSVVTPTLQDAILTVVTRDQRRTLPLARLFCYEVADQLSSRVERESRMGGQISPRHNVPSGTELSRIPTAELGKTFSTSCRASTHSATRLADRAAERANSELLKT